MTVVHILGFLLHRIITLRWVCPRLRVILRFRLRLLDPDGVFHRLMKIFSLGDRILAAVSLLILHR
jgi:hypothetical protein